MQRFALFIYKALGWKIKGRFPEEINKMVKDAEANKEADKKKRDSVDARNQADSIVFSTEKSLKEHGDKISAEEKKSIETGVSDLKEALKGNDIEDKYPAAKQYLDTLKADGVDNNFRGNILDEYRPKLEPIFILEDRGEIRLGTLSKDEWEAITLYCVFAFKKKS